MEYAGSLSGHSPISKSYQIGEAMANAGVPVVVGGAGNAGPVLAATTTASDLIGITENIQATLVTAQQTDNSDPARIISVITNPDAIYKARLSGGATSGTDLTTFTETSGSTSGLVVTDSGDLFDNPDMDEGTIHCFSGANVGISRKIASTSGAAATVAVAFPHDIVIGDKFFTVPFAIGENQFVQLTSDLTQINASVTIDTDNNNFRVYDLELNGVSDSFALIIPFDHIFAAGGSI